MADAARVAEAAFGAMLSLPLYTRMTDADVDRVVASVRKALGAAVRG